MNSNVKVAYQSPSVTDLGVAADICQISKSDLGGDSESFTNPQPFPGEGSGS